MKILILGAGQVGRTAAEHLSREEANEVTVVDNNEDALRDLQSAIAEAYPKSYAAKTYPREVGSAGSGSR